MKIRNIVIAIVTVVLLVLLTACGKQPTRSQTLTVKQDGCPPGLFKEIDSDECEELLDALDLDEDYDSKKAVKSKKLAKPKKAIKPNVTAKPKTVKPRTTKPRKTLTKPKRTVTKSTRSSSSGKRR